MSLAWQPDRYRGVIGIVENLARRVQEIENTRTRWLGEYQTGVTYVKSDQVISNGVLAIANQTTTEDPQIFPKGDPVYLYGGADPTNSIITPTLIVGNEYTVAGPTFVVGYRVYTTIGNVYTLTTRIERDGKTFLNQVGTWTEEIGGWHEFSTATLIEAGDIVILSATIREPDPTPTQFNGNWNYTKPNNEGIPAVGTIDHSARLSSSLRIHKTDADGGDRSAELEGLVVGDIIDGSTISWSIQAIIDNGSWLDFTVAPAQQDSLASGVTNFVFSTNAATPITHLYDVDYWATNQPSEGSVRGFYSTTVYEDRIFSDDAFGVDVKWQDTEASEHWDRQAIT